MSQVGVSVGGVGDKKGSFWLNTPYLSHNAIPVDRGFDSEDNTQSGVASIKLGADG